MQLKIIAATFVIMLARASSLLATTILDNSTPTGGLIALGQPINARDSGEQYWAQTFTTPSIDTAAQSLRFRMNNSRVSPYMGRRTDGDLPFRVLLTEVNLAGGFHPGNILFESGRQVAPYSSPSSPISQSFEILFPNVPLAPNTQYAFILDAFTDADYLDAIFPFVVMDSANGYNGGTFYSVRVPPDINNLPIGTRDQHFARTWASFSASQNIDLAFSMTFVPEPSAFILVRSEDYRYWCGDGAVLSPAVVSQTERFTGPSSNSVRSRKHPPHALPQAVRNDPDRFHRMPPEEPGIRCVKLGTTAC